MKAIKFIREIIRFIFKFSGLPFLIRQVSYRNKVAIIFYHDPKPEIFKRHIEYLSKHHYFIYLDKLVEANDTVF